jgi:hypothetical protein
MRTIATEDDDMAALFNARRVAQQQKRADNRAWSTTKLAEEGIAFTSHNLGAHLVVAGAWDVWPGTGRWRERKGIAGRPPREGRGIMRLLKILKEDGDV